RFRSGRLVVDRSSVPLLFTELRGDRMSFPLVLGECSNDRLRDPDGERAEFGALGERLFQVTQEKLEQLVAIERWHVGPPPLIGRYQYRSGGPA
ncbi:MAG: hypothetical protein J7453_05490, partial [Thermomicrobium sp.]|nr:hypothetical protein [Thermomicrobium sp.]